MSQQIESIPSGDETRPVNSEHKSSFGEFVSEALKTILLALVLYFAISTVTDRVRVENISMQPTLYEGQLLVVYKWAYQFGEPYRGDIIVFHHNRQPPEDYIKRIIGLPGDQISVRNGQVMVNGEVLNEPYIAAPPGYDGDWSVPEGQLFVLGDNRNRSSDSHQWGFVPMSDVVGRAVVIYWPPQSIRLFNHSDIAEASAP